MEVLKLIQGSPEWIAHRATSFNASDAPAMMGCSPHKTRNELLAELHTGLSRDVSNYVQERVFDPGHRYEALARPLAEKIIDDDLYPITGKKQVWEMPLSASFDGLTMGRNVAFEHKTLNDELRAVMVTNCVGTMLPMLYQVQMEQQCIVSGCKRVLFMASEWNANDKLIEERHCWYDSNATLAGEILAGWAQLQEDLETYVPPEVKVKAVGKTMESLPALHIAVTGEVTASNLGDFKAHALAVFDGINRTLTTDQHFADAEAAVKWCGDVESRLEAAKDQALSQTASIYDLLTTLDDVKEEARKVRLELTKLVEQRKTAIRTEIVSKAQTAYKDHITALNTRIGRVILPGPLAAPDFAGAIKGKRTVESLQNAADTTLATAKAAATTLADRVVQNLACLADQKPEYSGLFPDANVLALKTPEDLAAMITARISTHEANEAQRKAREAQAQAEREAELIAQKAREDAAKAVAEAEAKAKADFQAEIAQRAAAIADAVIDGTIDHVEQPLKLVQQPATVDEMHAIGEGIRNWQEPDSGAMLRLGEINERLKPLSLTAEGLKTLGFEHVATDKAAKLYLESDFPRICDQLIKTITMAKHPQLATA